MKKPSILLLSLMTLFFSCYTSTKTKRDKTAAPYIDTLLLDHLTKTQLEEISKTIPSNAKPVLGYRFIISGDFDGDGKKENLIEHFFSKLDNKPTNKFYKNLPDYNDLTTLLSLKQPMSFLNSDNKRIDTLHIEGYTNFGLSYLKNEGDLNGDGTDEVSYVVDWADRSNLNAWHLATYKDNKWIELYSFPIWDWQLPSIPNTYNQYGYGGIINKAVNIPNDTINNLIEKEFLDFKGLVTKVKKNKIQVIYRHEACRIDTSIITLKRLK